MGAQQLPPLPRTPADIPYQILAIGLAVAFCALASVATLDLAGKAQTVLEPAIGTSHAAIVRYALLLIGAVTTLIITLALLGIPIGQLLLGGALTSVFVGIAAQQSLSNVFAGMVLMLAHPFRVGDGIRLQAGALGGQVSGTIVEVGITYVRIGHQHRRALHPELPGAQLHHRPAPRPGRARPADAAAGDGAARRAAAAARAAADGRPHRHPRSGARQPSPSDTPPADSHPEVPTGTPEPRPSGTPT